MNATTAPVKTLNDEAPAEINTRAAAELGRAL